MNIDEAVDSIGDGLFGAGEVAEAVVEVPVEMPEGEVAATAAPEAPEPMPEEDTLPVPKTWRQEAASSWGTLPKNIREEVLKREADIFKGIEQYKNDAAFAKAVRQQLSPYMQILGDNPAQSLTQILDMQRQLTAGTPEQRKELLGKLSQQYGVDLSDYAPAYQDPMIDSLTKKIHTLEQAQQSWQTAQAEARQAEAARAVESFASDASKVYFNELIPDMTQLVRSGQARNLEEAYDKALWLNPAIRAKEMQRLQTEASEREKAERASRAAAAAKATAASVRAPSQPVSATTAAGSLDETLEATLQSIRTRNSR